MIRAQGMSGLAARISRDKRDAASPMISIARASASNSISSESRSARSRPATNFATVSAASIICSRRIRSSGSILNFGRTNDLVTEMPAEVLCGPQVNASSANQIREFGFHPCEREHAGGPSWFELDQGSTSLSAPAVPFNIDPNRESRRMWLRRQSAASSARSAKSSSPTRLLPIMPPLLFAALAPPTVGPHRSPSAAAPLAPTVIELRVPCRALGYHRRAPRIAYAAPSHGWPNMRQCHRYQYPDSVGIQPPSAAATAAHSDTHPYNIAAPQHDPRGTGLGD